MPGKKDLGEGTEPPRLTCYHHLRHLLAPLTHPSTTHHLNTTHSMSSAQQRLAGVASTLSYPKGLLAGDVAIITGVRSLHLAPSAFVPTPPRSPIATSTPRRCSAFARTKLTFLRLVFSTVRTGYRKGSSAHFRSRGGQDCGF